MKRQFVTFTKNEKIDNPNVRNFINTIAKENKVLNLEEEKEFFLKAKKSFLKGDATLKNKFIMSNALFLYKVARHYNYKFPNLSSEDLFGELYIGAHKAFDTFDLKYNSRFITWAVGYLKNSVFDYARKNNKIIKISTKVFKKGKLEVTEERIEETVNENTFTNVEFDDSLKIYQDSNNIESNMYTKELGSIVRNSLQVLSIQEQNVVKMYYGIDTPKLTKAAICNNLNLSVKEVNQKLQNSLKKLKNTTIKDYSN